MPFPLSRQHELAQLILLNALARSNLIYSLFLVSGVVRSVCFHPNVR